MFAFDSINFTVDHFGYQLPYTIKVKPIITL